MKYTDLIQLYFERSTALQNYWTLYVVIVGGLLAFCPCANNRGPNHPDCHTSFRFVCLRKPRCNQSYDGGSVMPRCRHQQSDPGSTAPEIKPVRDLLEPTLNPATESSARNTHLVSDLLTIAALWAMELRRRKNTGSPAVAS